MININQDRLSNEFLELVQIDSETKHETTIAQVLKQKFSHLGLDVFEDDSKDKTGHGAGNLICLLKGNQANADPIYITAHMDTVVQGNGINQMIKDGYITSDATTNWEAEHKLGIAANHEAN